MKLRRCSLLALPCLAALLAVGTAAHADTFSFQISIYHGSSGNQSGGGILTAVPDPNIANVLDITGLFGYLGPGSTGYFTLLPCANDNPYDNPCSTSGSDSFDYDNLLYPGGTGYFGLTILDSAGIGLDFGNGFLGRIFASSSHTLGFELNRPHYHVHNASFSIVPEPDSFILLGTGLLGVADIVRRRLRGCIKL